VTAETLTADYRCLAVFAYQDKSSPPMRAWWGNQEPFAYTSKKHLGDILNVDLPPFTDVVSPPDCGSANRHPIDDFFLEPVEQYHVVGQEQIAGRMLTIVELIVPVTNGDLKVYLKVYRAWLDLARGALPMKIERRLTLKERLPRLDRWQPDEITMTERVVELANGGFYPAETTMERWQADPRARLSEADWDDVRAGKRRAAQVVAQIYRWDCSLVEIKTDFAKDFFAIPFPAGQKVYDHDADPDADRKPLVEVGQQAPPLTIGRWLDGKQRTLEQLKGQVVVLNFWGLWCSGCRAEVPELVKLQKRFQDKPVTFISIHNPENDLDDLAKRIAEFQKKTEWNWIAAIDAGTEENSTTGDDYGVIGLPLMIVIDRTGKIVYVDFRADSDEPDVEKKLEEISKHCFQAVGEKWPMAAGLSEEEQRELVDRVTWKFIHRQIEAALTDKP
jgi:thiol-disulfide isomerase/thioredoxin